MYQQGLQVDIHVPLLHAPEMTMSCQPTMYPGVALVTGAASGQRLRIY